MTTISVFQEVGMDLWGDRLMMSHVIEILCRDKAKEIAAKNGNTVKDSPPEIQHSFMRIVMIGDEWATVSCAEADAESVFLRVVFIVNDKES